MLTRVSGNLEPKIQIENEIFSKYCPPRSLKFISMQHYMPVFPVSRKHGGN